MAEERTPLLRRVPVNSASSQLISYTNLTWEAHTAATSVDVADGDIVAPKPDAQENDDKETDSDQTVSCRVCRAVMDVGTRSGQHVLKCRNCSEATAIRSAPVGKKYVRCPCNCLLICKVESQRIACPRPSCKRIINLEMTPNIPPVPNVPGMCRVTCTHCGSNFIFNTLHNALARCPHCRKVSSVGPQYARFRGLVYTGVTALFFAFLFILFLSTYKLTLQHHWIYVSYIGLGLAILYLMYKVYYFCSMKISNIDGPV